IADEGELLAVSRECDAVTHLLFRVFRHAAEHRYFVKRAFRRIILYSVEIKAAPIRSEGQTQINQLCRRAELNGFAAVNMSKPDALSAVTVHQQISKEFSVRRERGTARIPVAFLPLDVFFLRG